MKDGILGYKMKEHKETCRLWEVQCDKCGLTYVNEEKDRHDCMAALKSLVITVNNEKRHATEVHGHDLDRLKPKCPRNHPLKFQRGKPLHYGGGVICDKCRINGLEGMESHYHCKECKYDLCRACMLIQSKRLDQQIRS